MINRTQKFTNAVTMTNLIATTRLPQSKSVPGILGCEKMCLPLKITTIFVLRLEITFEGLEGDV